MTNMLKFITRYLLYSLTYSLACQTCIISKLSKLKKTTNIILTCYYANCSTLGRNTGGTLGRNTGGTLGLQVVHYCQHS